LYEADEIRGIAGMDPEKLERLKEAQDFLCGGDSWSAVVIKNGWLVAEMNSFNVLSHTRFDIWSGTKSFTGTAFGLLLNDFAKTDQKINFDLESCAYQFIPEGYPLSDPKKEKIKIKHLLSMTSGIPGESANAFGAPTTIRNGPFEHAFGRCPNRYGKWVARLHSEPGTRWDYSDPAMCHLSVIFTNVAGRRMDEYLTERVIGPIGVESFTWDVQGGSGFIGPYTNAHTGVHMSARELARFGYLMLRGGAWDGREIVPAGWIDAATRSSQELNPNYGYTWWVNTAGTCWPYLPTDAFALMGYRSNKCYVIPSLDLVVARVGSGPVSWNEQTFIGGIAGAVI